MKCFKERLDSIDWDSDFEKADKENYEVLDSLCEYIKTELKRNKNSDTIDKALLLLAENFERYEENFVSRLEKEGKLTKELAELFYNNTNRRQG